MKSDGKVELRGRVEAAEAFIPAMEEKGTKVPLMHQIQTVPNENLNMDFFCIKSNRRFYDLCGNILK